MTEAFLAAALSSLLCGIVGTFVVLRRLVALGGGVAHAAFGGIGLALVFGFDPRFGALGVAVLSAAFLALRRSGEPDRQDALIGVLWAVGMAAGVWLLAGLPVSDAGVEGYLFGDIASVHRADLWLLAGIALAVVLAVAVFGRELLAIAFDPEHARLRGLPVAALNFLALLLVSLSVVALVGLVGIVLAIAMLTIPPLIALRLFRSMPAILLAGAAAGLTISLSGLALADRLGRPPGPAIVLVGIALLGLSRLVRRGRSRARTGRA